MYELFIFVQFKLSQKINKTVCTIQRLPTLFKIYIEIQATISLEGGKNNFSYLKLHPFLKFHLTVFDPFSKKFYARFACLFVWHLPVETRDSSKFCFVQNSYKLNALNLDSFYETVNKLKKFSFKHNNWSFENLLTCFVPIQN